MNIEFYNNEIEKMASKAMPFTTKGGDYATPIGWTQAPPEESDSFYKEYYRDAHKIPNHFRPIAEDGAGNTTFVDTMSDKANPKYYDWDHETTELTEISDEERSKMFTPIPINPKHQEAINKLKANKKGERELSAMNDTELAEYGYEVPKNYKPETKMDRFKANVKHSLSYAKPMAGVGALGGVALGALATEGSPARKILKGIGAGAAIGSGLGAAAGVASAASDKNNPYIKKDPAKEYRESLYSSLYDDEYNSDFLSQYK